MVEFIGAIGGRGGEIYGSSYREGRLDPSYIRDFARVHEDGGFDRVLVGYSTGGHDNFPIVGHAAAFTDRLGFLLAHRPGFISPTLAARKIATLDQLTNGRLAVHIITGGDDNDLQADGDWLTKPERYARTDEYLDVLKKTWTSEGPFDHSGKYYRVEGGYSAIKPSQRPYPPIYFGGSSPEAVAVAAKHADAWALWGEPLQAVRDEVAKVQGVASAYGRHLGISVSVRPILGPTEAKAWERAYYILERIKSLRPGYVATPPANRGSQRLLEFGAQGDVLDERLFTAIAKFTGARGNSTALVGTPEQVAKSLIDYVDAGATTLLIRGYDPFADALAYGRDLIPLVRSELRRRSAVARTADAVTV